MKTITIVNKKLRDYLKEKDILVNKGRKISKEIEKIEKDIEASKDKQRKYTAECEPEDLIFRGNALQEEINKKIEELNNIGNEVQRLKIENIPKELKAAYATLKDKKESRERERNKIALKVQKIKDRVIPIIQREVKPQLEQYEDIDSTEMKGEKIIVRTFNHLEQWIESFNKKNGVKTEEKAN